MIHTLDTDTLCLKPSLHPYYSKHSLLTTVVVFQSGIKYNVIVFCNSENCAFHLKDIYVRMQPIVIKCNVHSLLDLKMKDIKMRCT